MDLNMGFDMVEGFVMYDSWIFSHGFYELFMHWIECFKLLGCIGVGIGMGVEIFPLKSYCFELVIGLE